MLPPDPRQRWALNEKRLITESGLGVVQASRALNEAQQHSELGFGGLGEVVARASGQSGPVGPDAVDAFGGGFDEYPPPVTGIANPYLEFEPALILERQREGHRRSQAAWCLHQPSNRR